MRAPTAHSRHRGRKSSARVQEILDLRVRDIRLDPPHQVRLRGKGGKLRLCPIWPNTARSLRKLIDSQLPDTDEDPVAATLFRNQRGGPLTRPGVRYRLRKHLAASHAVASLVGGKKPRIIW